MIICPYCHQPITAGAVTITGDKYRCVNCNTWFIMENDKLKYTKFVSIR